MFVSVSLALLSLQLIYAAFAIKPVTKNTQMEHKDAWIYKKRTFYKAKLFHVAGFGLHDLSSFHSVTTSLYYFDRPPSASLRNDECIIHRLETTIDVTASIRPHYEGLHKSETHTTVRKRIKLEDWGNTSRRSLYYTTKKMRCRNNSFFDFILTSLEYQKVLNSST